MGIFSKITKKKKDDGTKPEASDKPEKEVVSEKKEAKKEAKAKAAPKKAEAKKEDKPEAKAAKDKASEEEKGAKATEGTSRSSRVLVSPVLTEKSERLQAQGKYTFVVDKSANKVEVARAVEDLYGVKPVSVRILVRKGRPIRFGRHSGRRKDTKRAVVSLKPGQAIRVID